MELFTTMELFTYKQRYKQRRSYLHINNDGVIYIWSYNKQRWSYLHINNDGVIYI